MKKNKEPGLLRQIIAIHFEQAKRRKALRDLNKLEWSVEFMEYLVEHAAKTLRKDIEIEIESPKGHKLRVKSVMNHAEALRADNDIFNRLDDNAAVQKFIAEHSPRR